MQTTYNRKGIRGVFEDLQLSESLDTSTPEKGFLFEILRQAYLDARDYAEFKKRIKDKTLSQNAKEKFHYMRNGLKSFLSTDPQVAPEFNIKTVCSYLFNNDTAYKTVRREMLKLINN